MPANQYSYSKTVENLICHLMISSSVRQPSKMGFFFFFDNEQDGFDMKLVCQPENSHNFSVMDLGLFNTSQSIQYKTIEELVASVHQAFEGYSVHEAKRIFFSHGCLKEAMKGKGVCLCN
ncbi:unnamed protein product [Urochloa humidicola]